MKIIIGVLWVIMQSVSTANNHFASEAPRNGMVNGRWTSGIKQAFGTSYESYDSNLKYSSRSSTAPISKVWFTATKNAVSEIYWPSIDTPQVRDSQFLVTDGSTFFFEERRDSVTEVEWIADGVPAYKITNSDRDGKFQIERTLFTDPDRDVVLQKIRIIRNVPGLKFFVLHNPSVSNTPLGDSARVSMGGELGQGLFASQDQHAQAVVFSLSLKKVSSGFEGASDGYQDISKDFRMDNSFETADQGNVALTAWLDVPDTQGTTDLTIAIGFGSSFESAAETARISLNQSVDSLLSKYINQWKGYQSSIADLEGSSQDGGTLFRSSVALVKSMEDKTFEGAFVASPSIPWGEHNEDRNGEVYRNGSRSHLTGGYHLVWPRDLYQMATTFLALNDTRSATASLNFLRRVQYSDQDGDWVFGSRRHSKNGTFPQNMWVNGEAYWAGLQIDETALPLILVHRLWKLDAIQLSDYWDMVRRGADFIADFGPWSAQERWEEAPGVSPSNIAAQIAALWTAGHIANEMGDQARANHYWNTADAWSKKPGDNLETWLFTTSGGHGNGKYFQRVEGGGTEQPWNPNDDAQVHIANGGGTWREKDIVDAGFLELVRLGVRPAIDPFVQESIPEVDQTVKVQISGTGPGWRRYTKDRYNYDDISGRQTDGMPWPLLTGERGHYELQRAIDSGASMSQRDAAINPFIKTMENMSTPNHMIPEQVWDAGPGAGEPTGSATPLGWAHGEYIKLLRSRADRAVIDRPRYAN
jgi:glucoamylase